MVTLTETSRSAGPRRTQKGAPVDAILRRLRSLTNEPHHVAHQRTLSFFGAWQALDDDPVLLCDCADERCPRSHAHD